jgi:hypothetical protein
MPVMDGFFLFIKELQNAQNQLWQATYYCRYGRNDLILEEYTGWIYYSGKKTVFKKILLNTIHAYNSEIPNQK